MGEDKDIQQIYPNAGGPKSEQNLESARHTTAELGETETVEARQTVTVQRGVWRTYSISDGLPTTVRGIPQDRHGYLWIGTSDGLCRYDGLDFTTYTIQDGMASNNVTALCQDQDGHLWLGTGEGHIVCFDGHRFTNHTPAGAPLGTDILAIHQDQHGCLWLTTERKGVFSLQQGQLTQYTMEDGLASDWVTAMCEDAQGQLWFGTWDQGLSCLHQGEFVNYTTDHGLAHLQVSELCVGQQGCVWIGTGAGLCRFDGEQFLTYTTADGLAHDDVRNLYVDNRDRLWIGYGVKGFGVSCFDESGFTTYTIEDGLLNNRVVGILQDREGGYWFAHFLDGLTRLDVDSLEILTTEPVTWSAFMQDQTGNLWFGNENSLCCLADGHIHRRTFTSPPPASGRVIGLLHDSMGRLWVSVAQDGLYRFDSPEAVWHEEGEHFTVEHGLATNRVTGLTETADGTIWAGTAFPGCLCRFNGTSFESIETPHANLRRLLEDGQGRLWMSGWDGLSSYQAGNLKTYTTEDGLPDGHVNSIVEDDTGNIWVGTSNSVDCFDGQRFLRYGQEDGLKNVGHQIAAKDSKGHLWFATHGGIYRYDGRHFQWLTDKDGLPSNGVEGLSPQSDGSMLIGTSRGIVHYHPTAVLPPSVEIREVVADEVYQNPAELEFTTETRLLTISYHGLSFTTRQMRYSYILEGYDKEWRDTWECQVRYENLPVGEYTFKVIAINRDLVESDAPATLRLKISPDPRDARIDMLQSQVNYLHRQVKARYQFDDIVGSSSAIREVQMRMELAVDLGLNVVVLILGETGTGKELVAHAIHANSSRKDQPELIFDCAATARELVVSELFGHRRGAFTGAIEHKIGYFEAAKGGTLVLDEIGDMPIDIQPNLLRVIQERRFQRVGEYDHRDVDVRIIAMTNRDLRQAIKEGGFREDLYHRLNGFPIHLPPLRDRVEDIPLLAEHFLHRYAKENDCQLDGFAADVFETLQSYTWPGNVRELQNVIHQAAAYAASEGRLIHPYHFPPQITHGESPIQEVLSEQLGLSASLKRLQLRMVENALRECGGNRTRAAEMLGLHRPNLVRLIRELGISM